MNNQLLLQATLPVEAGLSAMQGAPRIRGWGIMADAIRSHPWETTSLGPIEEWPPELVVAVNLLLSSKLISCVIWGSERNLIYNDLYTPLLGTKLHSLGEPFLKVWDEIREQAAGIIAEPWGTGVASLFERVPFLILVDGQLVERICTLTTNPIWVESARGPRVCGVFQTIIDHTEGELAVRKLRESEAQLTAIYDSGAVASALIDAKTFRYLRINSKLAEMLGQPLVAVAGTSVFDVARDVSGLRAQLEEVARGKSLFGVAAEGELANSPGEYRYWQSNYVPVRSPNGDITAIAAATIEVTNQRKTEAALLLNEKLAAVGRLAASIAHEINNPLESVTNLLYLAKTSQDLTEIGDYLDTAERELRRASAVTNQTLRFHKQSTNARSVTCQDLLESVISIYQGRLLNSNILVQKRKRARRPVECFDGEIRQVLNNLVANAIDALPPDGGRLLLRSREATEWRSGAKGLMPTVGDTGVGMSRPVQDRVFEAFYTTKGFGGTGLGLWVSKEIMDRHSGVIKVRSSQRLDLHGTVFTLFLPFEPARR